MVNHYLQPLTVLTGDCRKLLGTLPAESVHCCVTSPPYWGLRDYSVPPSVWGGDPACGHAWGRWYEWHDEREARVTGKTRTTERSYRDGSRTFNGNHQRHAHGVVCSRCGAWRGCLGLEPTSDLYVQHLVETFRDVRRVLREDGTLWLNLGDSYYGSWGNYAAVGSTSAKAMDKRRKDRYGTFRPPMAERNGLHGLKPKDLCGIP